MTKLALFLIVETVVATKLLTYTICHLGKFKDSESRLFNSISTLYLQYFFWGFFLGWIMWGKH